MGERLCLRTYGEIIRPFMKRKSFLIEEMGGDVVRSSMKDGQQIGVFYTMLLSSLCYDMNGRIKGLPQISSSLPTNLKQGDVDVPGAFVELAQVDGVVDRVEEFFSEYLIPNIPLESLDTLNDEIISLINSDASIGPTKQNKLVRLCQEEASRFHAETFVFAVQRNHNDLSESI